MERTPRRWADSHRCNGVRHDGVSLHRCSCAHPPLPREIATQVNTPFLPTCSVAFVPATLSCTCGLFLLACCMSFGFGCTCCLVSLAAVQDIHFAPSSSSSHTRACLLPWRRAHPRWTRKAKQKPCWTWITRKGACGSSRYVWCDHVQRTRTCLRRGRMEMAKC